MVWVSSPELSYNPSMSGLGEEARGVGNTDKVLKSKIL